MTDRERFNFVILLLLMLAGGLVLVSLFFQAMAWAPFLLNKLSWLV